MPSDRSQARVVTIHTADDRGQRLTIEPGSDHPEGRFTVVELILLNDGSWKATGTEAARAVSVERPTDAMVRRHLRGALEGCGDAETRFHLRQALQALESVEVVS